MVRLSTERKLQLTALFRAFDYDSSGSIEPQEFLAIGKAVKAASAKGGEWTEEMNAKAMARVDSDGGGSIDVDEFCGFFEKNMPKNRTQEQFCKLMDRYMAAAIAGRASYYFEEGKALREAAEAEAPESHKVKVSADAQAAAQKRSEMYIHKQERHLKRRCQYARAAEYAAEYASEEKSLVRQRRQAKAAGNYFCEPESKLMFVIRIRGMCDMHPKTKKILQLLRLRQIHLGVFLRVNKATQEMINRVEPYVAYGYPSLKATRELIYKRGFGKKKTMGQAQRVTLNCNDDIEAALGDHGINCFEDLIHEIYTVGPAFKQANNFLWPFKLNSAKGGLPKKRLGFNEGGQCGNREQYMSSLIFRML
jgi:large subunit ribosomal protein L7e